MLTFILRRLFYGLSVLAGVVTLVFFLFAFIPDPARELAGQSESEEIVQAIREKFNLDLPVGRRFVLFVNDLSPLSYHSLNQVDRSHLDPSVSHITVFQGEGNKLVLKSPFLGRSYITERPVGDVLGQSLPGTFILALIAMFFAFVIGVVLGVWSAVREGEWIDRLVLLLATIGMSGPSFFMAIIIAWIGGYLLFEQSAISLWLIIVPIVAILIKKWRSLDAGYDQVVLFSLFLGGVFWLIGSMSKFPALSIPLPGTQLPMTGSLYEVDVWKGSVLAPRNLILPALTLAIRPLAVISQLTRNSVLEVMGQEFVRTAKAKGLSNYRIMTRHVIRNAMNPVITAASGWLASMLAGAVFVEFVFGWKGLGLEVFRSLEKNDLPVVMGAVIIIAAIFVVINTLVDILYGWIDPRVQLK